jgi:DNA-binding response OmpR family regulator
MAEAVRVMTALGDDYAAMLEAENETLRERVRQLEDMLGATFEAPIEFGLTRTENAILGLLSRVELATKETILSQLYSERPNQEPHIKIIDVFVCKMRRKLKPFDIVVENVWGRGYMLSKASKIKLLEMSR